jgi:hypothetical protein
MAAFLIVILPLDHNFVLHAEELGKSSGHVHNRITILNIQK